MRQRSDVKKQNAGAVINIASFSGVVTSPLLAEYGAAKSFVDSFSRSLAVEYAPLGIHVQSQVGAIWPTPQASGTLKLTAMADTTGQKHALIWLLWTTPQASGTL